MTKLPTPATLEFVDRVNEMARIQEALKNAKEGKGQLLVVRGEAGSGKTRLVQEAAVEAEKQGFCLGFGTSLAESVIPYHPWKDILKRLGLGAILKETPPPRLLGVLCLTSEGEILVEAFRKGKDFGTLRQDDSILKSIYALDSKRRKNEETVVGSHDRYNLVIVRRPSFSLAAIIEGREDEIFLADMNELAKTVDSILFEKKKKWEVDNTIKTHLRQILESEKYEGVDYAKNDPKLRQGRFFELVTLGLSRKADTNPLCVVIDDMQWADPSSLALLQYVSRNTRRSGTLLLGTYRSEEAEARPHLKKALEGMKQEDILDEIDLKGLSRKDLPNLAWSFIGAHDLQDDFLDLLWRETQGNPLFVREVLKGLEEEGAISVHGVMKRLVKPFGQLTLPGRVREIIRFRLHKLTKDERRLLDAASTCGTRFTAALIAKVTGEPEEKVLNGLKSITQVHGLLHSENPDFSFNHSAIQEVLCDEISDEVSQQYHLEVAKWLELVGGPIEDVAVHYYLSRSPLAVTKLRIAAEASLARFANDEAARMLGEALELALPEERPQLLELQGDALEAAARYDEAFEAFEKALGAGAQIARCKCKIAMVRIRQGLFDRALTACSEGLQEADGNERALLLSVEAEALTKNAQYAKALEKANAALEYAEKHGDSQIQIDTMSTIGMIHLYEGRVDEAEKVLQNILEASELTGDYRAIGRSLNHLGNILLRRGKLERALDCHERALKMRQAIGDLDGTSASLNNIGNIFLSHGDFLRALEFFERALTISESIGNRVWIANQTNNIASVHYHLGDLEQAIKFYEKSLAMKEATGNPEGTIRTLINIGNVNLCRGDLDSAYKYYQRCLNVSEHMGHMEGICSSLTQMSLIHTERGDVATALKMLDRAEALYESDRSSIIYAETLDAFVYALVHSDRVQEARKRAEEQLRISKRDDMKYNEACSYRSLARCETAEREAEKARREYSRAIALFKEIKADVEMGDTYFEWGLAEHGWENAKDSRDYLEMALAIFQTRRIERKAENVQKSLEGLKISD